ncbi:MAG TPA: hypothetical protein VHN37_06890 [Actinomycetota bacterium]|nr:hypothetical protein [Actinomycetota bacterium]
MDRVKTRIALLLAATALSSVFVVTPASAAEGCPYPQPYCEVRDLYYRCVIGPIVYQHPNCITQ